MTSRKIPLGARPKTHRSHLRHNGSTDPEGSGIWEAESGGGTNSRRTSQKAESNSKQPIAKNVDLKIKLRSRSGGVTFPLTQGVSDLKKRAIPNKNGDYIGGHAGKQPQVKQNPHQEKNGKYNNNVTCKPACNNKNARRHSHQEPDTRTSQEHNNSIYQANHDRHVNSGCRETRSEYRRNASPDRRHSRGISCSANPANRVPQRGRRERPLDDRRLKQLLEREPTEIVMELATEKSGFKDLLNKYDMSRDTVVLLLEVMAKACLCTSSPKNLNSFLAVVWQSVFLSKHLTQFVCSLPTGENVNQDGNIDLLSINHLVSLLQILLQNLPSSSSEVGVVVVLCDCTFKDNNNIPDGVKKQVETIKNNYKMLENQESSRAERAMLKSKYKAPPDDFRGYFIIPGIKELRGETRPFLRHNLIKGQYEDTDHYLDVQFRLLREDFVAPLREGIAEYLANQKELDDNPSTKLQDVRLYHDVRIIRPAMTRSGPGHLIEFDISLFREVRWEQSKRLINGSLLCLTKDNFNTVVFATVEEREVKDIQRGRIYVKFTRFSDVLGIKEDVTFLMAETSAYFESYRHVLEGLQEYNKDNLPMTSYIVNVCEKSNLPKYLRDSTPRYDLRPLLLVKEDTVASDVFKNTILQANLRAVKILEPGNWPEARTLNFDDSQLEAYQAALSREFVLIQGPPGTGKTYVGLEIVKTLLFNLQSWCFDKIEEKWDHRAILVVCYTNHALDQFLEGIYRYEKQVVRIGGRSSSDKLQACNITNIRKNMKESRNIPEHVRRRRTDIQEYYDMRNILQTANERIANAYERVLRATTLIDDNIMTLIQYRTLTSRSNSPMYDWLGLDGKGLPKVQSKRKSSSLEGHDSTVHSDDDDDDDDDSESKLHISEEAELLVEQRQLGNDPTFVKLKEESRMKIYSEFVSVPAKRNNSESRKVKEGRQRTKRAIEHAITFSNVMTQVEVESIRDLWDLSYIERWRLYRYWLAQYVKRQEQIMLMYQPAFHNLSEERKEIDREEDYLILKEARVIGLTTTGAAKHRRLLQRIRPKIVVVEEAAEVLEAHIITTLSKDCQHLILIGDHQQLRPNPTVYRLAKKFNLDVSLFERMINNGLPCYRLGLQHRMRPEISILMKDHFYKGLEDHSSVMHYEPIKGISTSMFFIEHEHTESRVGDTTSKSNIHEATYLVKLCQYLLKQGYQPSQITILTTYTGQLFHFKMLMPKETFEGVRVSVVDNFQGEENDIILLSLVRSNEAGSIGFLKVANRVCVALSRAKVGLFCIGNMKLLAEKSDLWMGILKTLKETRQIGPALSLVCQNHKETITNVSCADDFLKVPDGGCMRHCKTMLKCGHACDLHCHPEDPNHLEYKCMTDCLKPCPRKHKCPLRCYEECKCPEILTKKFANCTHTGKVHCHQSDTATCQTPCSLKLPCKHACPSKCGEKCPKKCEIRCPKKIAICGHECRKKCGRPCRTQQECSVFVEVTLPKCGHTILVKCKDNRTTRSVPQYPPCKAQCERRPCGHRCPDWHPCMDPCPSICTIEVTKTWSSCEHSIVIECIEATSAVCTETCSQRLSCGHRCIKLCNDPCDSTDCEAPCQRLLTCNHTCLKKCNEPWETSCTQEVLKTLPECKHVKKVPCHVDTGEIECQDNCRKTLPCRHGCSEICGKPCTVTCSQNVIKVIPRCQHKITLPCNQRPCHSLCKEKCLTIFPCGHFCQRLCGETCEEICGKLVKKELPTCKHILSMPCTVNPKDVKCISSCSKPLPCGHKCVAKCGDPCTRLCPIKVLKQHPKCGHQLRLLCHEEPKTIECRKPCVNILPCTHKCPKMCYEPCEALTIVCKATVTKTLKLCGHSIKLSCHQDPENTQCQSQCKKTLPCGHPCTNICGVPCHIACKFTVTKIIPGCGHQIMTSCDEDMNNTICQEQCKDDRSCGHRCKQLCSHKATEPCDTLTDLCHVEMTKKLPKCEHTITLKCHEDPEKVLCQTHCKKKPFPNCRHTCRNSCWQQCETKCLEKVHKRITKCGHTTKVPCHLDPDSGRFCVKQCTTKLPCGHACTEKCGKPCTKLCKVKTEKRLPFCNHMATDIACHIRPSAVVCNERCTKRLDCGHDCTNVCGECSHKDTRGTPLPRCGELCGKTLSCSHQCQSKCGDCYGGRIHQPCFVGTNITLICGCKLEEHCSKVVSVRHTCDVMLRRFNRRTSSQMKSKKCTHHQPSIYCDEPCKELLKCKHPCIGICGEPCLPLCRFCHRREVLEISVREFEAESDPCYIMLQRCQHIFEITDLKRKLKVSLPSNSCSLIVPATCPKCGVAIREVRFTEHISRIAKYARLITKQIDDDNNEEQNEAERLLSVSKYKNKQQKQNFVTKGRGTIVPRNTARKAQSHMAWKLRLLEGLQTMDIHISVKKELPTDQLIKQCQDTQSSVMREIRRRLEIMLDDTTSLTEQLAEDLGCEFERLQWCVGSLSFIHDMRKRGKTNWNSVEKVVEIITSPRRFTADRELEAKRILGNYSYTKLGVILRTYPRDLKRERILDLQKRTKGFLVGEWFVCPRDHIVHSRELPRRGALDGKSIAESEIGTSPCPVCERDWY